MANQYEVLGKAPGADDLKKLSEDNIHLTIKGLSAGYGKMEILHNLDLFVSKAQSLCLIGPNGAGKSTILHSIYGFTNIFSGKIEVDGKEITNLTPAEKLKSQKNITVDYEEITGANHFYDNETSELIDISENQIKFEKIPNAPNGKKIVNVEVIINLKD